MIYLDHAATTPLRPVARDAWLKATSEPGNAASLHAGGQRAEKRLEAARKQVAAVCGCAPSEVVFTSGGTESNNLAVLGAARRSERRHIVVSAIEHKSVLAPVAALEAEGFRVTRVPVDGDGVVRMEALAEALADAPALVSVMEVNNELGSVQEVRAIARMAHEAGALMHVDAVQAAAYMSLLDLGADLVSLSAHKLGGPMGVGALVVRRGTPLATLQHGGGHERGLRAGTVNVAGVVAFGAAVAEALAHREAEAARLAVLRDTLRARVTAGLPEARALGRVEALAPHIVAFVVPGLDGESLVTQLDLAGLATSSGAACSALGTDPSHVLPELGLDMAQVNGSVRLSLGWTTTEAEVDEAATTVVQVARQLIDMKPMAL
jgi:cysteine desulfurase